MFLEFSCIEMTALPVRVRGVECYVPQLTVEWKCVAGTYHGFGLNRRYQCSLWR
jgi:hypothetical protein